MLLDKVCRVCLRLFIAFSGRMSSGVEREIYDLKVDDWPFVVMERHFTLNFPLRLKSLTVVVLSMTKE